MLVPLARSRNSRKKTGLSYVAPRSRTERSQIRDEETASDVHDEAVLPEIAKRALGCGLAYSYKRAKFCLSKVHADESAAGGKTPIVLH
jgi:hypothetical protein